MSLKNEVIQFKQQVIAIKSIGQLKTFRQDSLAWIGTLPKDKLQGF